MITATEIGFIATPEGVDPKEVAKEPIRIKLVSRIVGIGGIAFITILVLWVMSLRGNEGWRTFVWPLASLGYAVVIFIYRTVEMWARRVYRKHLLAQENAGVLVFVPSELMHAMRVGYSTIGAQVPSDLFTYDMAAGRELARRYRRRKQRKLPETKQLVKSLIHNHTQSS